jgi:hypothetical protein
MSVLKRSVDDDGVEKNENPRKQRSQDIQTETGRQTTRIQTTRGKNRTER